MIAKLCISKLQTAVYGVHVDDKGMDVVYTSIAEALADQVAISPEYAKFVNIEYGGVQLATTAVVLLRQRAHELAKELVQLSAEVHRSQ